MSGQDREKRNLLLDPRTQGILGIIEDAGRPLHVEHLAERLVKRDEAVIPSDEYEQRLEQELIALHHDYLPRLDSFGVVDYEQEENTVSGRDDPVAEVDWLDGNTFDQLLARLRTEQRSDEDSIGILEGRQAVIEYGRALTDAAEDELFCMFVSPDLLEDECLRRAQDAIDRGVNIFMGTREPDVRDLTRKHLPEATLWEPQRGWLTSPSRYPTVGRLVLVDRQRVMLAILDEPDSDGTCCSETAIVGEGENNPLVVLVRELLGPRLDHLDYQSADFQNELHS